MTSAASSPPKPADRSSNGTSIFAEALPEVLARDDFTNLAVLLRYAREGCWAFAIYSHAAAREEVVAALKTLLQPLPTYEWTYSPEHPSPLSYLDALTATQRHERAVVFFFDLERAPDELWKSLDYNRELLSAQPHGLVFWISNAGRGRAMRAAPHFWSQRSGVFDFRLAPGPLPPLSDWAQRSDIVIDDWENILRQIRITQGLLDELLATPGASPAVVAAQHLRLGKLCYYVDRLPAARMQLEAAESLASAVENPRFTADVLQALGDLALREADLAGARRRYEAALALYPQLGDRLGEANVLAALARVELLEGQAELAMRLLTRALGFYESINDRYSIAVALYYIASDLLRLDRREDAAPLLLQAAELFEAIGLPQYAVQARQMAGDAPTPAQQAARLEVAVAELRQRDDAALLPQALAALLALRMEMENWQGAVETAQELLRFESGNAQTWAILADAYSRLDEEKAAADAYAQAVAGDSNNAMLRRNYANTLVALERLDEAAAQLAVAAQVEPDAPYLALRYAELAKAHNDHSQAAQWAAEALRRQPDWGEAQEILAWAREE